MKLSYRGVSYEFNSTQNSDFTPPPRSDLKYRGATYRLSRVAQVENLEAILKYRGTAYSPSATQDQPEGAVAEAVPASVLSLQDKARGLTVNHHQAIKHRQQVMLSRSAAQVGLPTTAANYWNHIQGQIHPTFRATYDRSHAALS